MCQVPISYYDYNRSKTLWHGVVVGLLLLLVQKAQAG